MIMNNFSRILVPFSTLLLFSLAGVSGADENCSCTCGDYLEEMGSTECQAQCNAGWEEWQCAASTRPETMEKDAETMRFEAELREMSQMMRYPLAENVIAPQVYLFQNSLPEQRQTLWEELEKSKQQLAQQQALEAVDEERLQNMPTEGLDEETLRYKAAVEQLNLPPGMAEDLVEMFQANDAAMRETLWQRVRESPLKKQ
jgi:hypothetical protein